MKAFVVMILVLLAAASAFAYGRIEMAAGVASVVHRSPVDEPIWLLLSGSVLIGVAGALRRSTF